MYNTALNTLIWGKTPGNPETREKTADHPWKVYKTVGPMTKRCTVREGQYLVLCIFKAHKDAMYSFIGHTVRWGLGRQPTNPCQLWNHTFSCFFVYTPLFNEVCMFSLPLHSFFPFFHLLDTAESSLQNQTVWCILYLMYVPVVCFWSVSDVHSTCFRCAVIIKKRCSTLPILTTRSRGISVPTVQ